MLTTKTNLRSRKLSAAVFEAVEQRRLLDGTLDASFGNAGVVNYDDGTDFLDQYDRAATRVASDGKLVSVAEFGFRAGQVAMRRLNADGSIDASFGSGGSAIVDLGLNTIDFELSGVELGADDSTYVAGRFFNDNDNGNTYGFVGHINADGNLDTNFGDNGLVLIYPGAGVDYPHLAIDGSSIYVGTSLEGAPNGENSVMVAKLNADGSPNLGFGTNGVVTQDIVGVNATLGGLFVDGGNVTLVGATYATTVTDIFGNVDFQDRSTYFAQLDSTGALNTGFGTGGFKTTLAPDNTYEVSGVARGPNGYVVGGDILSYPDGNQFNQAVVTGFDADGDLDTGFADNGVFISDPADNLSLSIDTFSNALAVDANGLIYAGGFQYRPADGDIDLLAFRLTPAGALDVSFDDDGIFLLNQTSYEAVSTIALDADGAAIMSGVNAFPGATVVKFAVEDVGTPNQAPIVNSVNGPANADVNTSASFVATVSDPDAGDSLEVSWDFGDGTVLPFTAVSGGTASAAHTYATPGSYTVSVIVRDAAGALGGGSTSVTVVQPNRAPTVASVTGPSAAQTNVNNNFNASFGDLDVGDSLSVAWDFGDGSTLPFTAASGTTASASHAFTTAGTYTVTFTVKDAAGATATGTTTITITTPPPAPYTLVGGKLTVAGTTGNDTVDLSKSGANYVVVINGTSYNLGASVTSAVINGGSGNDVLRAQTSLAIPVSIFGGDGNDSLRGGAAADVLSGDAGNDVLAGGAGDDLLIGGTGSDDIAGAVDQDILISGTTTYASNSAALSAIMAEWTSNHSWAVRVANVTGLAPQANRLNGSFFLQTDSTVFGDNSVDTLSGGAGTDIYYATLWGSNSDVIRDVNLSEALLALLLAD